MIICFFWVWGVSLIDFLNFKEGFHNMKSKFFLTVVVLLVQIGVVTGVSANERFYFYGQGGEQMVLDRATSLVWVKEYVSNKTWKGMPLPTVRVWIMEGIQTGVCRLLPSLVPLWIKIGIIQHLFFRICHQKAFGRLRLTLGIQAMHILLILTMAM